MGVLGTLSFRGFFLSSMRKHLVRFHGSFISVMNLMKNNEGKCKYRARDGDLGQLKDYELLLELK